MSSLRFECPDLTKYDTKKCHLKGKTYSIKEKAPEEDLPICMNHCRCTDVKGKAEFVCPKSECAGYKWTPESAGCQHMFTENSCCSKPICGKWGKKDYSITGWGWEIAYEC